MKKTLHLLIMQSIQGRRPSKGSSTGTSAASPRFEDDTAPRPRQWEKTLKTTGKWRETSPASAQFQEGQHRPTPAFRQLATAPLNGMLYLRKMIGGNKVGEVTVILHLKYPQILSTLAKTTSFLNNGKAVAGLQLWTMASQHGQQYMS